MKKAHHYLRTITASYLHQMLLGNPKHQAINIITLLISFTARLRVQAISHFAICSTSTTTHPFACWNYVSLNKSLPLNRSLISHSSKIQMAHIIQSLPYIHFRALHPDKILLIPWLLAPLLLSPSYDNRTTCTTFGLAQPLVLDVSLNR